jgi:hypothetical protein
MPRQSEAVKKKLDELETFVSEKSKVNPGNADFLLDILAVVRNLNDRVTELEISLLPGDQFITDTEIPHRLK